jgi:hypothetical protein
MTSRRGSLFAAVVGAVLTACTRLAPGPPAAVHPVVLAREDLSPGFIGFIGPKTQHAPPFLGTPGTNFYCLRSFLDRRTGEAVHQLYVSDSYYGTERDWNAARDSTDRPLPFVPLTRDEITCDNGCSYVEEFAVTLSESVLRGSSADLQVTLLARSGNEKTVLVSRERIAAQLAAVDARRNGVQPVAVIGTTPP